MRKLIVGALCALAVIGIGAGVTLAGGGDDETGGGDSRRARTFTLAATADGFVAVNHTGDEPAPGDSFVEHFTFGDGVRTGAVLDECVVSPAEAPETLCTYVVDLDDGVLTATALVRYAPDGAGGFLPEPFDAVVTGGSGAYEGATGVVRVEFADHDDATWSFTLR
jgi:hypothetical protein